MKDFYVYQLVRPGNGVPCYIDKGCGERRDYHAKLGAKHYNKHLASIYRKAGDIPVPVVMIAEGLTENEAFALEIKLIAEIGRQDQGKGPLCNWSDGGEGRTNPNAETRAKMSIGISAAWTDERRVAHTARSRAYVPTAATIERICAKTRGRKISDEERARRKAYWTAERRAAKAAMMTPEKKAEMSARCKAAVTDKTRAKISEKSRAYQARRRAERNNA